MPSANLVVGVRYTLTVSVALSDGSKSASQSFTFAVIDPDEVRSVERLGAAPSALSARQQLSSGGASLSAAQYLYAQPLFAAPYGSEHLS